MSVTIISCLYGDTHDRFVGEWLAGIARLNPKPAAVIVATDHPRKLRGAKVKIGACSWKHPQAFYLNTALHHVETDWVWLHDIDDYAFEDALQGLDDVAADVWQMGYERSDGEFYLPPHMDCVEVLAAERNPFVAGSCVRTAALRSVGGFADLALQDWALWRALAREGASFQSSDRTHFYYRRHSQARGERELTVQHRPDDMSEMTSWEEYGAVSV
jgi:hypothetical protein